MQIINPNYPSKNGVKLTKAIQEKLLQRFIFYSIAMEAFLKKSSFLSFWFSLNRLAGSERNV